MAAGFFTEEDQLGAVSGAAHGCGLFTEDDLLAAVSGAAGSYEREQEKEEGREGGCALSWYRGWFRVRA